jgi:hypothetical protein
VILPWVNRGRFLPLHAFIAGLSIFLFSAHLLYYSNIQLFLSLFDTHDRNSALRAAITGDGFMPLS